MHLRNHLMGTDPAGHLVVDPKASPEVGESLTSFEVRPL